MLTSLAENCQTYGPQHGDRVQGERVLLCSFQKKEKFECAAHSSWRVR